MFEKEIKFITDFNLNKIKTSGSFFTLTHLASANVHPAIIQYISAELDYLISYDRARILQKSVFDYSGEEINRLFGLIATEIKKEKLIPYEDIKKLVTQAVEFNMYFLVRPRWCLKKFIFGDEEVKSQNEISMFLNYSYFYDYYKKILNALIEKKKIVTLSVYEFEDMIVNLEKQLIEKQNVVFIENSLQSLAEFFNLGEIQKTKLSVGIVEKFLYEKGLLNEIFKVRKLLSVDPKAKYEIEDYKYAILSNVLIEQSDVEISEKVFEMPKTSFQSEDLEITNPLDQIVLENIDELKTTVKEVEDEFIETEILSSEIETTQNAEDENIEESLAISESEVDVIEVFDEHPVDEIREEVPNEFAGDEVIINVDDTKNRDDSDIILAEENEMMEQIIIEENVENIELINQQENEISDVLLDNLDDEGNSPVNFEVDDSPKTESEESISNEEMVEVEIPPTIDVDEVVDVEELVNTNPEENTTSDLILNEDIQETEEVINDEAAALYDDFLNESENGSNAISEEFDTVEEQSIESQLNDENQFSSERIIADDYAISEEETVNIENLEVIGEYSQDEEIEESSSNLDLLESIEKEIESLQNSELESEDVSNAYFEITEKSIIETEELPEDDEETEIIESKNQPDEQELADIEIEKIETEEDIVNEGTDISNLTNDTEILVSSEETIHVDESVESVPKEYHVSASADDIFELFAQKETSKIISVIFQKDELDFVHTVEQIAECKNFKQVEEILNLVFHSYRINQLTCKEAILFKEKIAYYFKEKGK
ncbi:MAG: hypothetical protein KF721_10975 [Ignavibacteriaceae bacterium]|nr:hypothetical protein [Ignavibacteriaceae bacterium]